MYKSLFIHLILLFCLTFFAGKTRASQVLGVHILHPTEIGAAADLIKTENNAHAWSYVTLPLSLADLSKKQEWQDAFNEAKKQKIIPLVRLVSRFDSEQNAWAIPTRGDILQLFTFLGSLEWPHEKKYLIIFNEPNHAKEWGGRLDPVSYAEILRFAADWAHTENQSYQILPAAMDLAAPNGSGTLEAFNYLGQMLTADPEIFTKIDYWNSHSYPNPGFSAAPTRTGQNSLRGFEHELTWLKDKAALEKKVFITETGWEENSSTKNRFDSYYTYANDHIWSDERVIAITPFVLKGDPGPFAKFTFIDQNGNTSLQYQAYAKQVEKNALALQKQESALNIPKF